MASPAVCEAALAVAGVFAERAADARFAPSDENLANCRPKTHLGQLERDGCASV